MPKPNHAACAINAAGIADAFRVLVNSDTNGAVRLDELARAHEGWCGVMLRIAEAGELMERFRAKHGGSATWGGDLPYLYEVWDAIAQGLWENLITEPLEAIVQHAIERAVSVGTA